MTLKPRILNRMKYNYAKLLIFLIGSLVPAILFSQGTREGSIELPAGDRSIGINDKNSSTTIGIEGSAFTIEGWVKMQDNDGKNFCFFKLESSDYQMSFAYRGDNNKNSTSAWVVETKNYPEVGPSGQNWSFGYKSGYSAPNFLNTWHHVAFAVNDKSTVKLFIDGEFVAWIDIKKDGDFLADMFPKGSGSGDGDSRFGGSSINNDIKGPLFLNELRVWNVQLSAFEIATYYNEEVNKNHPKWDNLVRYYTGTEISGSGSSKIFEDRSPKNEYDGRASDINIGLSSTEQPIIRPPSFTGTNKIDFALAASTCGENAIDVSWTSLNSGTIAYRNNTSVAAQIRKVSSANEIYAGTGSAVTDNTVPSGGTETYELRAYWLIKGIKYYSETSVTSNIGSLQEDFPYPTNFKASQDKCDESIFLTWNNPSNVPPKWQIQKANNINFTGGGNTGMSGGTTSKTFSNQQIEEDVFFRIRPIGTDKNGCTIDENYSAAITGFTSKPPVAPANIDLAQDLTNKNLTLTWDNPNSNNADSWIVKRTNEDGSNAITFDKSITDTALVDDALVICQTYIYSVAAVNECAPNGVFAVNDVNGNISTDLSNTMNTFTASKGYLNNSVELRWTVNGNFNNISRFKIFRTKATENNYELLKIVTNELSYYDETALPGVFYNYKVVGEASCNTSIIFSNQLEALGFITPFGVANGHIEYNGGNAIEGVTVDFDGQSNVSGKSIYLDNSESIATNLHFKKGDYNNLTVECWVNPFDGNGVILSANSNSFFRLANSNGVASFWGKFDDVSHAINSNSVLINDGNWHHLAGVISDTTIELFVDGELVSKKATTGTFGNNAGYETNMVIGGRAASSNHGINPAISPYYQGYIDEVRV